MEMMLDKYENPYSPTNHLIRSWGCFMGPAESYQNLIDQILGRAL